MTNPIGNFRKFKFLFLAGISSNTFWAEIRKKPNSLFAIVNPCPWRLYLLSAVTSHSLTIPLCPPSITGVRHGENNQYLSPTMSPRHHRSPLFHPSPHQASTPDITPEPCSARQHAPKVVARAGASTHVCRTSPLDTSLPDHFGL
jgi:hypothetical protein